MAQQVSSHETTHTEACDEYNVFILLHVSHQSAEFAVDGGGHGTIGIIIGITVGIIIGGGSGGVIE